jgi:hypothetical protein
VDGTLQTPEQVSPFDAWRRAQGLTYAQLGALYGVGHNQAYFHSRMPGSPRHKVPRGDVMKEIVRLTDGAIRPDHFYDLPELWTLMPVPA